jgi:hypothetical protein
VFSGGCRFSTGFFVYCRTLAWWRSFWKKVRLLVKRRLAAGITHLDRLVIDRLLSWEQGEAMLRRYFHYLSLLLHRILLPRTALSVACCLSPRLCFMCSVPLFGNQDLRLASWWRTRVETVVSSCSISEIYDLSTSCHLWLGSCHLPSISPLAFLSRFKTLSFTLPHSWPHV